jgi:hypothetical protein
MFAKVAKEFQRTKLKNVGRNATEFDQICGSVCKLESTNLKKQMSKYPISFALYA